MNKSTTEKCLIEVIEPVAKLKEHIDWNNFTRELSDHRISRTQIGVGHPMRSKLLEEFGLSPEDNRYFLLLERHEVLTKGGVITVDFAATNLAQTICGGEVVKLPVEAVA
jgi:hypothetical protein